MKVQIKDTTSIVSGLFCNMESFLKGISAKKLYEHINAEGFKEDFENIFKPDFTIDKYNEFFKAYLNSKDITDIGGDISMEEIIKYGIESEEESSPLRENTSSIGDFICKLIDYEAGTVKTLISVENIEDNRTYIGLPHRRVNPFSMEDQIKTDVIRIRYQSWENMRNTIICLLKNLFIPDFKKRMISFEPMRMITHTDFNRC